MHLSLPGVWIAVALLLSLVAGAGVIGFGRPRRDQRGPWHLFDMGTLRGRLSLGVLLLATVPPLFVVAALTDRHVRVSQAAHAMQTNTTARQLARSVDAYLDSHIAGVRVAAASLGEVPTLDSAAVTRLLERTHRIYPGFLTLVAADMSGEVRGATQRIDGTLRVLANPVANVAQHPFFTEALRTSGPYLSPASRSHGLTHEPVVAISMAVIRGSRTWGVVRGALDLPALRRLEKGTDEEELQHIVITDPRGSVVYASADTGLQSLTDAKRAPLYGAEHPDGTAFRVKHPLGAGEGDVMAVRVRSAHGWSVVAMMPVTTFGLEFLRRLNDALPWLALSVLGGALLARWLAHSLSDPLDVLVGRAATLRLDSPTASFRNMGPMPREFRTLARQLHRMSWRLRASYRALDASVLASQDARAALQEALENQERQITERTRTLAEANAELQRMSSTDSLTQLPNRRRFNEFLQQAVRSAVRNETALTCLLVDVDHFKAYNDTYGHQPGDWCLSAVGSALRVAVSRPLDMVARYGGEEFAALLLDTDPAGAAIVAERARAAIEALEIEHAGSKTSRHVTISVGVCTLWPQKDTAPQDLVAFADAALYAAKANGRNVCAFRAPDGTITIANRAPQQDEIGDARARSAADRLMQLLKRGKTA